MKSLFEIRDELELARLLVVGGRLAASSRDISYGASLEHLNGIMAVLFEAADKLEQISQDLSAHIDRKEEPS